MATNAELGTLPWYPLILSVLCVAGLVVADYRQLRPGRYLFKPLAAVAFIWLALALDAPDSNYGRWLLAGLCLCMLGDLSLMLENDRSFLVGLSAFLCGHLLYAVAFLQLPANGLGLLFLGPPAILLLVMVVRWLSPYLEGSMRLAVHLYVGVITLMLLCASLTLGSSGATMIIIGAWGFAISDVAVARRQFVNPGPANGLWGTPLYFFSQMLLAASVACY